LHRKLTAPIQTLVAATRAVAKGDFDTRLPMRHARRDRLPGYSFNDMTKRLARARRG
jgi:nitrogen fixation/metabolism regulation signal transduction histidine kinase